MKRIMFNDKYGLTQAVLEGRKTMTRRVVGMHPDDDMDNGDMDVFDAPRYKVGEVLALAQKYQDVYDQLDLKRLRVSNGFLMESPGWTNKMFVRSDFMPNQIRITNVRIEKLQDISDEDCMREGIVKHNALPDALGIDRYRFISYAYNASQDPKCKKWWFRTPRAAFAALIDKVSGKGTWESNPWVFVYEFELVK